MEKNGLEFKFDIKLQKLSIISLATYLWKLPTIKEDISSFFKLYSNCSLRCKNWGQVVDKVFNIYKLLVDDDIPAHLKLEMNDGIISIGDKILHWVIYLTEDRSLDYSLAEDIYFTYYGVIDEKKIFQNCWEKNPVFDFSDDKFILSYDHLVCAYIQEGFIEKNKEAMLRWRRAAPLKHTHKYKEDEVYLIITSGICYYTQSKGSQFVVPQPYRHMIQKFTSRGIAIEPKDMFQISVAVGLHIAVEYFLDKMDDFTIEKEIPSALNLCFKKIVNLTKMELIHLREKYMEIFLNLLNRIPENEKFSFMSKHQRELLLLLLKSPFQNFYILVLEKTANSLSNFACNSIVMQLTNYIMKDCRSQCNIRSSMYQILLQMTWCRIDDQKKGYILRQSQIMSRLFTHFQFSVLRTLINIRMLPDGLEFNDVSVHGRLQTCIKQGKFNILTKFVKEVFSSADEVEIFKTKMLDCFDMLIEKNLLKKAEQFLDWLASSNNDRAFYKNQIDNQRILRKLITKGKLVLADLFLMWRFDAQAERKNCKELLRKDEVIQAKIDEILKEPENGNMSFNLLEWLGHPEKDENSNENILNDSLESEK